MARKIEEIQNEMLTAKDNKIELAELQDTTTVTNIFQKFWNYTFGTSRSSSRVAIWRLWVYVVSYCIWTLETLFDIHSSEIDKKLSELKPHTLRWYRNKALAFQYGFDLFEDSDKFNNDSATQEQIELSKIVKYSAVTEASDESRLIIKIATQENGILSPVNEVQHEAFKTYVSEFKDAGVPITIINFLPDRLRLNIRIVRDALVLNNNGMNRLTGTFPVNDMINDFLKSLPFNGQLSIQKLEAKILEVEGVKDLNLDLAETAWIDSNGMSYGTWNPIDISVIPVSGYFTVNLTEDNETKSTVTYV
ncbi:nucleotidyltransferase [Tenacibaculum maritimum]|nr:nucleotidyltransferase [Tenacibaculum maritimum]MDB0600684.1 nucleotidyltransferase [Tenacibaculum maritimum]MDB0612667.1 nucleotidyltransferase [Tenacibaculum maritimum]